jgi:phosphoribosylanthranilate isomerase
MTFIKFCGLTRAVDLAVAVDLGVNAVGFVLWPQSPRAIDLVSTARLIAQLPGSVTPVGVFVNPTVDEVVKAVEIAGIRVAQVHGVTNVESLGHSAWNLWVAASLNAKGELVPSVPNGLTVVLDAYDPKRHGGTGQTIDWQAAKKVAAHRLVILAGGLTPDNVGRAVAEVRPHGVDVSSGIEEQPGIKSETLMRAFVKATREAEVPAR